MSGVGPGLLIAAFVVLVGLAVWAAVVSARKRREAFMAVAAKLGLQYSPDDPFDTPALDFSLFSQGESRSAGNVLWGDAAGMRVRLFDYEYVVRHHNADGPDTTSTYRFSCAICELDAQCPHLSVEREGAMSWLAGKLGFHDIEFESEEFNKTFRVTSDDKRFAFAFIDARMMAWLLAEGGICRYETTGPLALCYGDRVKPAEYENLLEVLRRFHEHVPSVVSSLYPRSKEARA